MGSSTKNVNTVLFKLFTWAESKEKLVPSLQRHDFIFPVLVIKTVVLLNRTGALKKWEGQSGPLFAQHSLLINSKPFSFWEFEKPNSRVCFPWRSQPNRSSHSNGQGIAPQGTANYAEDETCKSNTCRSVCSPVWVPG